ncbi:MAG: tetratricopeptide repeat protein [Planctomycetaceae bacterium]|nr:tetratricopeptide repeat protein [Planctomycetaceae bacterium]
MRRLCAYLGLGLLVLVSYGRLAGGLGAGWPGTPFDFIAIDDPDYVSSNSRVQAGLTAAGVRWAFGRPQAGNWHPLTWLSLMLDCQMFGPNPAALHAVNLALHLANAWLLLLVLERMTGRLGISFCAAALWAVHPLRVESVAWISERKDVLSTCFALLALLAYERYARRPSIGRYLPIVGCFALSLLAKQMWVTLPFVLLLVDYWPLGRAAAPAPVDSRYPSRTWRRLWLEKLPLLGLSLGFSLVIYYVQQTAGAMGDVGKLAWGPRLANVLVGYGMYLAKSFWPTRLAIMYRYPSAGHDAALVVLGSLALLGTTVLAVVGRRRWPWLFVGWCWFVGMLFPVSGVVPIGSHAWADRYSYAPQIGLAIAFVWSAAAVWRRLETRVPPLIGRAAPAALLALGLIPLGILCSRQVSRWQSTERLFAHTIAVTDENDELELTLAGYLATHQQPAAAEARYRAILRKRPKSIVARLEFATFLIPQARFDEAAGLVEEALRQQPDNAAARSRLGAIRLLQNRPADAVTEYETAIRLRPDWAPPRNDLAWLLATHPAAEVRSPTRAVELAESACRLTGRQDPSLLDTLAAAQAAAEQWEQAIRTGAEAASLARGQGNKALAAEIAARVALYERRLPVRSP